MAHRTRHPRIPMILIVDDNTAVAAMLSRAIRQRGYQVLTAGDGLEALACLNTHPIDLLLSDMVMPILDGVALCMRVRAEPAWADLPIIVMTAANPQAFPPTLATEVVQKPIPLETLDQLLDAYLPLYG